MTAAQRQRQAADTRGQLGGRDHHQDPVIVHGGPAYARPRPEHAGQPAIRCDAVWHDRADDRGPQAQLPVYLAVPDGPGPWPGVVVIHDGMGMGQDVRNQADWLAGHGYLAAAPDLFRGRAKISCMISIVREAPRQDGSHVR